MSNYWINRSGRVIATKEITLKTTPEMMAAIVSEYGCTHKVVRFKDGIIEEMGWIIPNYENSMEGFHAYISTFPNSPPVVGFIRKDDAVVWCPQDSTLAVAIFGS